MEKNIPIFIIGSYQIVPLLTKLIITFFNEINSKKILNKKYELHLFCDKLFDTKTSYPVFIHQDLNWNYLEVKLQELNPPFTFFCDPKQSTFNFQQIKDFIKFISSTYTFDYQIYSINSLDDFHNLKENFIKELLNFEICSIIPKIDDLIFLLYKNSQLYKFNVISTKTYSSAKIYKLKDSNNSKKYLINKLDYIFIFNFFSYRIYSKIYNHLNLFLNALITDIKDGKLSFNDTIYLDFLKYNLRDNEIKYFLMLFESILTLCQKLYFKPIILIQEKYYPEFENYFKDVPLFSFSYDIELVNQEQNINIIKLNGIIAESNLISAKTGLEQEIINISQKSSIKPIIFLNLDNLLLLDKTFFVIINSLRTIYQKLHKVNDVPIKIIYSNKFDEQTLKNLTTFKINVLSQKKFNEEILLNYANKLKL
ncbi:MAG TPA: hypothetical protein PLD27_06590 [bacterium]|nr:hypothetical protein [bacterium]HPQ17873.1 hypothetical protein [bacterium]